ncbi:MAG TPA: hypothetical protein VEQ62_10245, partial [Stellaceae bacterium]|nr:hypothetical protein [Stellaceae bacterium]
GRLPVVDMRDDREIADEPERGHGKLQDKVGRSPDQRDGKLRLCKRPMTKPAAGPRLLEAELLG